MKSLEREKNDKSESVRSSVFLTVSAEAYRLPLTCHALHKGGSVVGDNRLFGPVSPEQ